MSMAIANNLLNRSIKSSVSKGLLNITEKAMNNKTVGKYFIGKNLVENASKIALWSCISKDAINCCYYVYQSWNNERIPEEKRKFVAFMDLANGVLNVATQFALGKHVDKLSNKVFDKYIAKKCFSDSAIDTLRTKVAPNIPFASFAEKLKVNKNFAKKGLAVISTLVVAQVISKRIIVPLIATPMATLMKDYHERKSGKPNTQPLPKDTLQLQHIHRYELPECYKVFK